MLIRRKGDLPLQADPETQRVWPPGQGPRWHQDPSSKRYEGPPPDPAGEKRPPGAGRALVSMIFAGPVV